MKYLALAVALGVAGCSASTDGASSSSNALNARSAADFDADFATQWGPTAFNAVGGAPDGYDDCGPTSLVMVAAAFGVAAAPTPATAEAAIRAMRVRAHGSPATTSSPTYGPMMLQGLSKSGLSAVDLHLDLTKIDADVTEIDALVNGGATVLVAGDPGNAWGRGLDAQGQYLHPYNVDPTKDHFGHWVVAFAATNGGFYVGDPLSKAGVIEITRAELVTYLTDGGNVGGAIRVDGPTD